VATVPDLDECKAYLDDAGVSYSTPAVGMPDPVDTALNAEVLNQLARVTLPTVLEGDPAVEVPTYTADLLEAVYARVARRLVLRGLPLGVSPTATDSAIAVTRVGGLDAEVGRLEAPYRRVVLG
jgi:hypothetical protein